MLEALWSALQLFDMPVILYLLLGVLLCTFVVVIPGLGGAFILALVLPFTFAMEPVSAIALLVGASVVSGTGNTITSVLFGVPGSSMGVATCFDGYPLTRKGQGARALAAGLMASAMGGVIGAVVLAMVIPVVRPLVLLFGPAEFLLLIAIAVVFMAYVGESSVLKGLTCGMLGLLLSLVGQEASTGTLRYTFGQLYLWDGIALVPFVIGLFAVSEMVELAVQGGTIVTGDGKSSGSVWQGILDVFRHWKTLVRGSLIGLFVGLVPGLGGSAAQFMAYTQEASLSPRRHEFGTGMIEGVIAPEAATNSKDGGAFIPTLAFGVPGSSGMAILLVGLMIAGVTPGAKLLTEQLDTVALIIWLLLFANLAATALCLAFTDSLAKLTHVRVSLLVPVILVVSLFGAFATRNSTGDLWTALIVGVFGYFMKRYKYSRATLVIGLVLGNLLEKNFLLSMKLYSWSLFLRPIPMVLTLLLLLSIFWPLISRTWSRRTSHDQ